MERSFYAVVVGGGASGFFAALSFKRAYPQGKVLLIEKSARLLAKVAISGGGRCNVTHDQRYIGPLLKAYPRGGKLLRNVLEGFSVQNTVDWFAQEGVVLKTEPDGRMFPISDHSGSIVNALLNAAEREGIVIRTHAALLKAEACNPGFRVFAVGFEVPMHTQSLILAMGGMPKMDGFAPIHDLALPIKETVPSLFTFNLPDHPFAGLQGVSVPKAEVRIVGTEHRNEGPLLITHWGLSGPAVIVLSAHAARTLHQRNYRFALLVNWVSGTGEGDILQAMEHLRKQHGKKKIVNACPITLPARLWEALCERVGVSNTLTWEEVNKKSMHRLMEQLIRCPFTVEGKTTYKEEFVTCGGVSLEAINLPEMESKQHKGLYVVGEFLDVDGITGGYNFQFAWASGYFAGLHAANRAKELPADQGI
jgi:predicted Rossmann fold flavoprotein